MADNAQNLHCFSEIGNYANLHAKNQISSYYNSKGGIQLYNIFTLKRGRGVHKMGMYAKRGKGGHFHANVHI